MGSAVSAHMSAPASSFPVLSVGEMRRGAGWNDAAPSGLQPDEAKCDNYRAVFAVTLGCTAAVLPGEAVESRVPSVARAKLPPEPVGVLDYVRIQAGR